MEDKERGNVDEVYEIEVVSGKENRPSYQKPQRGGYEEQSERLPVEVESYQNVDSPGENQNYYKREGRNQR